VKWLLAKPDFFDLGKVRVAHWGLIHGEKKYNPESTGVEYRHPAGPTALALYTLLKCGVPPDHPTVVEGFAWLKAPHSITAKTDGWDSKGFTWSHAEKTVPGSYELSTMILAVCAKYDRYKKGKNTWVAARAGRLRVRDPADLEWLNTMVAALVERRGIPKPAKGADKPEDRRGWRYNVPEHTMSAGRTKQIRQAMLRAPAGNQDLSSTQLATLALFSANRFGVRVKPQVWFDIVDFTLASQETEGPEHERFDPSLQDERYVSERKKDHARGFAYILGSTRDAHEGIATGAMTAAGVANLLMAREILSNDSKAKEGWEARAKAVDTAVWDGLAWLDANWSSFDNRGAPGYYPVYYLYALERAMDLLGKNLVGRNLWYSEGAKELLSRKKAAQVKVRAEKGAEAPAVFWDTDSTHDPEDVLDTCFALLFLKRATKDMIPPPPTVTAPGD